MGMSGITTSERRARGGPFDGLRIPVSEPDNNLVMLDFGEATFAVVDGTFDVVASKSPRMELFGLEGTLLVHREDTDRRRVELQRLDSAADDSDWISPAEYGLSVRSDRFDKLQRGVLVEHLADCLRDGTRPVPSAEHARHVLEIVIAARTSAREGVAVDLETTFQSQEAM
jgi:predicted dehydrogenase